MRDAGILDGDYVFIRQQTTAQPRDIVVALIGDETTVKRFVPAGDVVRLEPEPTTRPFVRLDDPTVRILARFLPSCAPLVVTQRSALSDQSRLRFYMALADR
jgi:repressor LexA